MDGLLGGIGALVMALIAVFVLRGRSPKDDQPHVRPGGPTDTAAQREALRRRKEEAVREKLKEVDNRPVTGDAVADLESRLGYERPHRDSTGEPAAPGDGED